MESQDYQLLQSLKNERQLQILKDGVCVLFFSGENDSLSYLEYQDLSQDGFRKFQQMFLPNKYPLELFDYQLNKIIILQRDQYIVSLNSPENCKRIYLNINYQELQVNTQYILTKYNATIGVHSILLLNRLKGVRYFEKLQNFIDNPQCVSIPMDKQLHLKFEYQSELNKLQNKAIQMAFCNHITYVKGPPGCGKTVTVSRMIRMMASQRRKILIGSASNIANVALVSNIIKQLEQWNQKCNKDQNIKTIYMIIHSSKQGLERFDENAERFFISNQILQLISKQIKLKSYSQQKIMKLISKVQQNQCDNLQFIEIYNKSYKELIDRTSIFLTTTANSLKLKEISNYKPEIGILDEAAQASITDAYGFLSFGINRLICVGDQKQLSPTVIGNAINNCVLKKTMFELAEKNSDYVVHLIQQYRMHPQISQFANVYVYNNILQNAKITQTERQSNIQFFKLNTTSFIEHNFQEQKQIVSNSVLKIDQHTGIIYSFEQDKGRPEYYNQLEGSLIMDFLIHAIPYDQWKNVTILTFYKRQMLQIQYGIRYYIESLGIDFQNLKLTVKTIDGYQGGQKDYIIVSTVRSDPFIKNGQFFANTNRVNVALTRAKKGLLVFGNSQILKLSHLHKKELNIWGKFYKYNQQKKRIYNSWQLESFITNEIHFANFKNIINHFDNSINSVLENLNDLKMNIQLKIKLQEQISQKNPSIERQVKKLVKLFRKIPLSNVNKEVQRVLLYNFLAQQSNQQTIEYYSQQQKSVEQIIRQFALNHFTYQQVKQTLNILQSFSNLLEKIIYKKTSFFYVQNVSIQCGYAIINKLDQQIQKVYNKCSKILCNLRSLKDQQYSNQSPKQKIKIKSQLISLKLRFKCFTLIKYLCIPTCNDLIYSTISNFYMNKNNKKQLILQENLIT